MAQNSMWPWGPNGPPPGTTIVHSQEELLALDGPSQDWHDFPHVSDDEHLSDEDEFQIWASLPAPNVTILGQDIRQVSPSSTEHEVQMVDDDRVTQDTMPQKPFVREGHFRFMDLPAELRVHIYSFLLPHNVVLSHWQNGKDPDRNKKAGPIRWVIEATDKNTGEEVPFAIGRRRRWGGRSKQGPATCDTRPRTQRQLFTVNKEISKEARGMFSTLIHRWKFY